MKMGTILIVEDEKSIREIFSIYLELEGYEILNAENGESALKLLKGLPRTHLPDCIILDIMMPKMDGNGFLREMKNEQDFSQIPVVICSAWGAIDHSTQIVEVIKKPVDLERLKEVVERCCRIRK